MKRDQEDEYFEKGIDDEIPVGFHEVIEEDAETPDGALDEVLAVEGGLEDDPLLEDEVVAGDFGGKDFDFEHEEEN